MTMDKPQEPVADDDLLEAVEQEVGMSHGGWDMVSASKLVAAFRKHLRAAPASTAAPAMPEELPQCTCYTPEQEKYCLNQRKCRKVVAL